MGKRKTYSTDAHITSADGVKDFFRHIVYDLSINFHPDDDFKDYTSYETHEGVMSDEQAELYNRLMDEAFDVCGDETYDIACEILDNYPNE